MLRRLREPAVYEELEGKGARLEAGLAPFGRVQRVGAMVTLFLADGAVRELRGRADERHRALRRALPPPARARDLRRAVAVRVPVRLARARRRGHRPHGRGRWRLLPTADLWDDDRRRGGGREPALGRARCAPSRSARAVFSPLAPERFALGLETIYEGYLVHYGRPRLFAPADEDEALLLGDYLYAHGLVRIAATGELDAVATLAELISTCAHLRAEGRPRATATPGSTRARRLGGEPRRRRRSTRARSRTHASRFG